jgi:hypothetical protein
MFAAVLARSKPISALNSGVGFFTFAVIRGPSMLISWIKRRRSREERARKVVQGIRQGLRAGHLLDRKKRKGWKKRTFSEQEAPAAFAAIRRASSLVSSLAALQFDCGFGSLNTRSSCHGSVLYFGSIPRAT